MDDRTLRKKIIGKYGYVDQDDDARYHRPIIKKEVAVLSTKYILQLFEKYIFFQDDKKMIRYRDGKIVSTKGERFTQVTKQESEEMKKSYVNNPSYFLQ